MILQWHRCENSLLEPLILSVQVKTIFGRKLESRITFPVALSQNFRTNYKLS